MNIFEIAATLPHGFHDAFLKSVRVDYLRRTAELELEVWVGDLHSEDRGEREAYRAGKLLLTDLRAYSVDLPNAEYLEDTRNGLRVDLVSLAYQHVAEPPWPGEPLPSEVCRASFVFTDELISHLHLAAGDARWEWLSEARCIY